MLILLLLVKFEVVIFVQMIVLLFTCHCIEWDFYFSAEFCIIISWSQRYHFVNFVTLSYKTQELNSWQFIFRYSQHVGLINLDLKTHTVNPKLECGMLWRSTLILGFQSIWISNFFLTYCETCLSQDLASYAIKIFLCYYL